MTLRGPADADRFRVKYRGARYYIDPLPACDILPNPPVDEKGNPERLPSFTAVKSLHGKTFKKRTEFGTFDLTALRAANYVADNAEHLLQLDRGGIISAVGTAPDRDLNKAGQRGTQIHLLLEAKIKGHALDKKWVEVYAPAAMPYVDAIEAWWADQRPEAMYAEVVGLNWEHKYAFTSDVLGLKLRSYGDKVIASDWKTRGPDANHGAYFEEGMQLAAANGSEYIFVDRGDGTIVRRRPPVCDLGVVVSIKPDSVEMYEVDLDKAWEAFTASCEGWRLRQSASSIGNKAVANRPTFVQPELTMTTAEMMEAYQAPVIEAIAERQAAIAPAVEEMVRLALGVAADPFAGVPDDRGVPQMDRAAKTTHLRDRLLALDTAGKQHVAGAPGVPGVWPAGVLGFTAQMSKNGDYHTVDQLRLIETAIASGERITAAPFPDDTNDGEPLVPADSALIVEIKRRFEAIPPGYQPKPPAGIMGGKARLREVEKFADTIAGIEEGLEKVIETYRAKNATKVTAESANGEVLKAGRLAAKELRLPPPRGHQNVRDDVLLWRAVS